METFPPRGWFRFGRELLQFVRWLVLFLSIYSLGLPDEVWVGDQTETYPGPIAVGIQADAHVCSGAENASRRSKPGILEHMRKCRSDGLYRTICRSTERFEDLACIDITTKSRALHPEWPEDSLFDESCIGLSGEAGNEFACYIEGSVAVG